MLAMAYVLVLAIVALEVPLGISLRHRLDDEVRQQARNSANVVSVLAHSAIEQGNADTLVYPFHVKFNQKTFYRTRNILVTNREDNFTCFVDKTNLWQCGYATGVKKDGKMQEIMVTK